MPSLIVRDIRKSFGNRVVLKSVSFDAPKGSFISVFGPNGAGKTTLLRILATLERPQSGSFFVAGADGVQEPEIARGYVGYVGHKPLLYLDLTARQNLCFFARLYGVANPDKRAEELLEVVELSYRQNDAVRSFSRGMIQRLSIARALLHRPNLLLLDEPYTGLDPHACALVDDLLTKRDAACTVVMVSHDHEHAYEMATHALALARGRCNDLWPCSDVEFSAFQERYRAALAGQEVAL